MNIACRFVLAVVVCSLGGCSFTRSVLIEQEAPTTPVHGRQAECRPVSQREHISIGRVHVHSMAPTWLAWLMPSGSHMVDMLKAEGERLGGDTVIEIQRYSWSQFEWREEHLMGTAVLCGHKRCH